jgi:hypothetical protein
MTQEQFLESRRPAGQGPDARLVQAAQDGVQGHLVDLGADPQAVGDQVVHPGQARQVRGSAGLRVDRDPGQVPQLGQRASLHRAAVAEGARLAEQAAFLEFATREMAGLLTRWQQYQASLPPIA